MRAIVCGGRNFTDVDFIFETLNNINVITPLSAVIHGAAQGVDRAANLWANANNIVNLPFPPSWDQYGKAAGPIRNQQMLNEGLPDLLIAFPGGPGTSDMIRRAHNAGVPVIHIRWDP